MTEFLASLREARRVRQIKRKIRRVGTGEYKPGGSSKPGHLYSPLPFAAFDDVPWQREACAERFELIRRYLPGSVNGGRLLDIGCATGFNCFKFSQLGLDCVGIDIDPESIDIASDVAALYDVSARFHCGEATPELISSLGPFHVALFLSSFQWITSARGFDYARRVLEAAMRQAAVVFFETSMGNEGRAKMPMLPDGDAVRTLLADTGVHDEVMALGDVLAPNVWLQKTRVLFRTRRTS